VPDKLVKHDLQVSLKALKCKVVTGKIATILNKSCDSGSRRCTVVDFVNLASNKTCIIFL